MPGRTIPIALRAQALALKTHKEAIQEWTNAWAELEQQGTQAWIERITYHIDKVIELEGGNHYREKRTEVV